MKIQDHVVVSLNYKLSNHKTGEKIEETTIENPMVFLYGVGGIIPEFEENLRDKQAGDNFEFAILADNAYGLSSAEMIAMIPQDVFHDENGNFEEAMFTVGALVPMSDSDGNHLRGKILEVTPEFIKMDFNHPLADTDLHFVGEILSVRAATQDEIDHGHAHGPGGHQH
jgi:FKBP-type peptidyl-prolyl cis-trans isomerase SlyD